jgi:hypothetical protein
MPYHKTQSSGSRCTRGRLVTLDERLCWRYASVPSRQSKIDAGDVQAGECTQERRVSSTGACALPASILDCRPGQRSACRGPRRIPNPGGAR